MKSTSLKTCSLLGALFWLSGCGATPAVPDSVANEKAPISEQVAEPSLLFDHLPRGKILNVLFALPSGSTHETAHELGSSSAAIQSLQYQGQDLSTVMNQLGLYFETWVEPNSAILAIRGSASKIIEGVAVVEATLAKAEVKVRQPHEYAMQSNPIGWVRALLNLSYGGHSLGFLPRISAHAYTAKQLKIVLKARCQPHQARIFVVGDKANLPVLRTGLPASFRDRRWSDRKNTRAASVHPKTAIQVVRITGVESRISLAIPLNLDTPEKAARADIMALTLRQRIKERASTRRIPIHELSALIFAPAKTARLLLHVRAKTRHIDELWKLVIRDLRDLGRAPPSRSEIITAAHVLDRQVERIDTQAFERARRLVHFGELWGDPVLARSRWNNALRQVDPPEDQELFKCVSNPKAFTAIVEIPQAHHEGEADLYAESLVEHAKRIWAHKQKSNPGIIVQIEPNLTLISDYRPGRDNIGIHLHLKGGQRQVPRHLLGVNFIASALLGLRVPQSMIINKPDGIGLTMVTTTRGLGAALATISRALDRSQDWTADEFELGRAQALQVFDKLNKSEDKRFKHQLERHLNRMDGWSAPTVNEIRDGIVNMTTGQAKAWYGRYVTDTPTTLGLSGTFDRVGIAQTVRSILGTDTHLKVKPILHVRPVPIPKDARTVVVTTERPRGAVVYDIENPTRTERATVHVLARALQAMLTRRSKHPNGKDGRIQCTVLEEHHRSRLLVVWTGRHGSNPSPPVLTPAIDELCQTRLSQADFLAWRNRHVADVDMHLTNPMNRATWLTEQAGLDSSYVKTRPVQTWRTISDGVSLTDIQTVAKKLFHSGRPPIRLTGMPIHSPRNVPSRKREAP